MPTLTVSIVMPCLNEAATLGSCILQAQDALLKSNLPGEIVVADNGSTDGSCEIASAHGVRLVSVSQKGYGHALQAGISAASGRYVLMGDADGSYDFEQVGRFVQELEKGYDLVMGNRFSGEIRPGAMPWKNRYIGNPILTAIGRILFKCPARDFHCGLRAFRKDAYDKMNLRTGGMEFASEMVIRATLLKLRIGEIPTTLSPDGRNRPPHLRPWRDGWRHLRFMLLFSPRWLFFYPGIALMTAGLTLGGILLPKPLTLGGITLDIHTLLFCAMAILIGFQAVLFAILTKVFAIKNQLLPEDERFRKLMHPLALEVGLTGGIIMLFSGFILSLSAVFQWGSENFGELSPTDMLRLVIPGGLLLTLGCQLILSSSFLGILSLKINRQSI